MQFQNNLISELKTKFPDLNQRVASAACQVYLELCEVRKYWNVHYEYDRDLQCLYFKAKLSKSSNFSIFIPFRNGDGLSVNEMQKYFKLGNSIFLVIICPDSTCVFYEISNDLILPVDVSAKHLLKSNKHEKIDAIIKKKSNLIREAALCGLPLNLNTKK